MVSDRYSETLIDHFEHPRNAGAMEDADAEAYVMNPVCGDSMRIFLRIDGEEDEAQVAAASFLTSGCPASIATSSAATELVVGLPLDEAASLTREDYAEAVGGLPKSKLHCSVLAASAVRQAIEAWRSGNAAASDTHNAAVDDGTDAATHDGSAK